MKRVMVLLNAGSGASRESPSEDDIRGCFRKHGIDATLRTLSGADLAAAAEAIARKQDGSFDALIVGGGDGSISAAAGALADSEIPLGVLALGTLNHFAKDLGIPLDLEDAVAVIARGESCRVDVADLNGRVFINNSSVGLYPFMVARRNARQRQHGESKLVATFPAAMQALLSNAWHHLTIDAAGSSRRVRTPCVFVGNNPYEVGPGQLGKRTGLQNGELCVHVVRQQSRLGVLLLPLKVALGFADPWRDIETFSTVDVRIASNKQRLQVSLDGEVATMPTPLQYRSRPGALLVLAPPPEAAEK